MGPAVREAVREFGNRFDVKELRTFADISEASILGERLVAHVLFVFGTLAVFLAVIGIYGVVAYSVTQRAAEIGLRMALGARMGLVVGEVVGRVMLLVACGVALGLCGVAASTPFVSNLLFRVAPFDPLVIGSATLTVVASGALAACGPASRAARRIDPNVLLKGV